MKNRIFAVLAALVLIVGVSATLHVRKAHAQATANGLTMGTTVTANVYGGANYFYLLISGGNVTTFNIVNQNAAGTSFPLPVGDITVVFQQDGTGSRTVGWGTMIAAAATPTLSATANKYTVVRLAYDTTSGLYYTIANPHN